MPSRGRHAAAESTKGWACMHGQETLQHPMKTPLGSLKPCTYYVLYPLCCPHRFVCPCHSPSDAVPVLSPPPVFPSSCPSQSMGFYSTTVSAECSRCPGQESGRCGSAVCLVRRATVGGCDCLADGWIAPRFLQSLLGFPLRWQIRSVLVRERLEVPCS